jgi:integrase
MAVYKPKRKGIASKFYICEFVIHGKRVQESTGSTSRTVAREYEKRRRAELERVAAGLPTEQKAKRIRTVEEVCDSYLVDYGLNHRNQSIQFAKGRLKQVKRLLARFFLSDLTQDRIRTYIRERQADGVSGRTINMELGELSRAMGQTWRELWPRIKKLEERKNVGRALSQEEQRILLDALESSESHILKTLVPILLLTGMRSGEAICLAWGQVNVISNVISVGRAKTSSGTGRVIPINDELAHVLAVHRRWFIDRFGNPQPEHYLFPFGHPVPLDPSRHITSLKWAWTNIRQKSGVSCRMHDLRHTFATGLAENGVPESTMLSLMGHMSRAMLERYSHIRMAAKVNAVSGISLRPTTQILASVPVKVPVPATSVRLQ